MKKYLKLKPHQHATHLKIELYYNLGGYNYFTYREEKRGYYLSVTPVTKEDRDGFTMESVTCFTGVKMLIKEVKRKSEKSYNDALDISEKSIYTLVDHVLRSEHLELMEDITL